MKKRYAATINMIPIVINTVLYRMEFRNTTLGSHGKGFDYSRFEQSATSRKISYVIVPYSQNNKPTSSKVGAKSFVH